MYNTTYAIELNRSSIFEFTNIIAPIFLVISNDDEVPVRHIYQVMFATGEDYKDIVWCDYGWQNSTRPADTTRF